MKQNIVKIRYKFPDTHFFVFRNKQYPFKIDFFRLSSKFFSNQHTIPEPKTYQLIDEETELNLNLSDEIITTFIKYVQNEPISLNNDNIVALNYLANKYEIESLIEDTDEYISNNYSELAIDILLIHQNDPKFETKIYENCISNNFSKFVNIDRLLSLDLSILYRIIENVQLKKEEETNSNDEFLDFLIKYLDKYGMKASVLFEKVDFEKVSSKYFKLLTTEYSKKLDFHFINFSIIKKTVVLEDEFKSKNMEVQSKDEIIKNLNDDVKDKDEQIKRMSDDIQNKEEQIQRQNDDIKDKEEQIKKLNDDIQNKDEQIKKLNDDIQNKDEQIQRDSN